MRKIIIAGMFFLALTFIPLNAQREWAKTYGGSDNDEASFIQQTSDGGYIVAGYTRPINAVKGDIWILKLSTAGVIEWQRTYGESDDDYAECIQQTNDGSYIVAGHTKSFGAGGSDIWILKLDSKGNIKWQRTYGGSDLDLVYSIQQTDDDGYILVARTCSFGAGSDDIWILKLDSEGNIKWQRTYGGTSYDMAYSIQQTSDRGYIVAGRTYSFGEGKDDAWILKLTSSGDIEWQRTYGGSGYDGSSFIQQTSDGGYIVLGYYTFDCLEGADTWILKLNPEGEIEWQQTYKEIDGHDFFPRSFQQTSDGGYIVAGWIDLTGWAFGDAWILKLTSIGDIEWQRIYGESDPHSDNASSIQETSDGGYIAAGSTNSFGAGNTDIWILKLDSEGEIDPSCGFIRSSNAIVSTTHISPSNTSVTPVNTNVTPQSTHISPQDTNIISNLICSRKKKGGGRR